jgi:hypothetical protein
VASPGRTTPPPWSRRLTAWGSRSPTWESEGTGAGLIPINPVRGTDPRTGDRTQSARSHADHDTAIVGRIKSLIIFSCTFPEVS